MWILCTCPLRLSSVYIPANPKGCKPSPLQKRPVCYEQRSLTSDLQEASQFFETDTPQKDRKELPRQKARENSTNRTNKTIVVADLPF